MMSVDASAQRSRKKAKLVQFVLKPGPRQTRLATRLLNDQKLNMPFPFLRLPPELRNKVYNFIFALYVSDELSPRIQQPENRLCLILDSDRSNFPNMQTTLT